LDRLDCDELFEAYAFLAKKLLDKSKFYQGDRLLSVWVRQTLGLIPAGANSMGGAGGASLYADYLAFRYGRETLPRILASEPAKVQQVFQKLRRGWTEEEIAALDGQMEEEVQAALARIEAKLHAAGPTTYWYWLGFLAVRIAPWVLSDEEGDTEGELRDPGPNLETLALAHASRLALEESLARLSAEESICLKRRYFQGWTASQIGMSLVPPQDAVQVEELIRHALQRMVQDLCTTLSFYGEVEVDISRLRSILREWDLGNC